MGLSDTNYSSVPLKDTNKLSELIKFENSRIAKTDKDKYIQNLQRILDK